jgi:heme exporter protein A
MLRVKNLTFSFKNRPLFQNISFDVKAGELTRLAGSNGSGKSTMLGLITGLISGAEDAVSYTGDSDFREWTSWIAPDANGLIPTMSATANLSFWLELRGTAPDISRLRGALTDWGLSGDWVQSSLPVARFSTGMKRRLALARLLLEDSKLWLLDEPLFGLDDAACRQFRDALKRHLSTGGSAVVVTHDDRLLEGLNPQTILLGAQ